MSCHRIVRTFTRRRLSLPCLLIMLMAACCLVALYKHMPNMADTEHVILMAAKDKPEREALFDEEYRLDEAVDEEKGATTLIQFPPILSEQNFVDNDTFDNAHLYPCAHPEGINGIEDLMCVPRPSYLPSFKNPCYRDKAGVLRCLPYFQLLGYDKCGTTDFFARLLAHPEVAEPKGVFLGKEVYYWCWRRYGIFLDGTIEIVNLDGYARIFQKATEVIEKKEGQNCQPVVGDGGPIDMWDFRAWPLDPQNKGLKEPKVLTPHHIRHIIRDPKFIVMVRDPVERMYSDYLFVADGYNAEDFDRDVPAAIDMMNACLKVNTTRQCFYSDFMYKNMPMRLHISCYSLFLREWLSVFHRKHFFFLRTEDYHKEMKGSLQDAFSFLGLETLTDDQMDKLLRLGEKNKSTWKSKAGKMSEKARKLLEEFYAPCNQDLSDLLKDERFLWQDT